MRSSSWLRFTVVLAARGVIAALVGVVFWGIAPLALGWHTTTVMTGSMQPTLLPGDVVVSKPVPAHDVRAGQVLLFPDPDHTGVLRLHRLQDVDAHGDLVTKGDANPEPDSTAVARSSVVGVGYLRVPLVGLPVVWAAEHRTVPLVALAAGIVVLAGFAVVPAVRTRTDSPTDRLPRHGRHRAARPRRARTRPRARARARARTVVVAATVCAVVGVALPAPAAAAAAAFAAATTTGTSSITTAVATPVTGLTCVNVGNAAADVGWAYSGVAPERFTVLVDGAASGISTAARARDVTLGASDFFVWKTSTISVRTDLTDTWTATSSSTVRITTIRLFGLGRTSCAR
ncbi:signal peptidase I [Curtobacterium sp. MCPF17_031]|uniref:signal peptidase I n=1 Tax=Curtobacterium sp. MCPF17_031 TaxID=2175653 RepID=UPI000DA866BC|nr:signal peptidase I [Curtobacterium sp. MCPF17_031]PZE34490.1 signal peptidase I [Curtobacterium sp. MCPF17_031]